LPQLWKEQAPLPAVGGPSGGKLRVGYVSADFVNHPTADLMQSALLLHDKGTMEIFLYSISRNDSSVYRKVLMREIPNFRALPNRDTDRKCAEAIAQDRIHVLVNLNSHTAGERNGIFVFRPAPVQLVYLAYPGTHGASYLDYNVVDKTVSPREHRDHYTEALVYMPHCYQTNSFKDLYQEVLHADHLPSRAAHALPEDAVVLCTFNRLGRITPDVFHTWCALVLLRLLSARDGFIGLHRERFCFCCSEQFANLLSLV
jgi:protein O-GlcNAc transferase